MPDMPLHRSAEEFAALVPHPACDANKYSRGTVGVIGGSRDYPGAPVMTALAAARTGAGYVRLVTTQAAASVARAHLLSIPVTACRQSYEGTLSQSTIAEVLDAISKSRVLVVGPGLSADDSASGLLTRLLEDLREEEVQRPIVFDADALNIVSKHPELLELRAGAPNILTPHEGEAARLLGRKVQDRVADALDIARRYSAIAVLKGPKTLIASPEGTVYENTSAGPELAKAGTGDVLAGIIGALAAQGLGMLDAASLGVHLHGVAGSLAARQMGVNAVLPEDIISNIGPAYLALGA